MSFKDITNVEVKAIVRQLGKIEGCANITANAQLRGRFNLERAINQRFPQIKEAMKHIEDILEKHEDQPEPIPEPVEQEEPARTAKAKKKSVKS